jgi:hypothetical protein
VKRELPFLTPLSIAFTIIVFVILGISVWRYRGAAFSPGAVTAQTRPGVLLQGFAAHADFEADCKLCHNPLAAGQSELCVRCHENIAAQQAQHSGTHGLIAAVSDCRSCHPEHKGASFDPLAYALTLFDHSKMRLPLTGAHATVECAACHVDENYQLAYQGCVGCHAEPELHAGMFEKACDTCHTDLAWQPALLQGEVFDHARTGFSLAHHAILPTGQRFACVSCHTQGAAETDLQPCAGCHTTLDAAFMDSHAQTMGTDCLQCHDGADRMEGFDHAAVFSLDGKHSQLNCESCHAGFQFRDTPSQCSACHAEPDIHAGYFGLQCQRCHTTQAWRPAWLIQHTFPLDHGESGELACQACHTETYSQYTCYTCHEHQPAEMAAKHSDEGITSAELVQCAQCHPAGRTEEGNAEGD